MMTVLTSIPKLSDFNFLGMSPKGTLLVPIYLNVCLCVSCDLLLESFLLHSILFQSKPYIISISTAFITRIKFLNLVMHSFYVVHLDPSIWKRLKIAFSQQSMFERCFL